MKINQLRSKIREYREILNQKNNTIGSIIKHHRKEQKLTLEDTSEGICSVSYLCKVEMNQITPSDRILPGIIERLSINETTLFKQVDLLWLDMIMIEEKVPEELLIETKSKNDYQSKLIAYAYDILNLKDYTQAYNKYIELTSYLAHFTEEEMTFFLYLVIKVSYMQEKYMDVISLNKEISEFTSVNKVIVQVRFLNLKAVYKTGHDSLIKQLQNTVVETLIDYNDLKRLVKIRSFYLAFEAKYISTESLEDKINNLRNLDEVDINYIWFIHYYRATNLEKALDYIRKIHLLSDHYYVMYIITLSELKKGKELATALSIPFDNMRVSYEIVKAYLLCDDDEKIDYIRNTIIYCNFITQEKVILDFLYKESVRQLKAKYLYKEAVYILEKINKALMKLNYVII